MADRKVSVKLEADVTEYTAKLAKAAAATRELGSAAKDAGQTTQVGLDDATKATRALGEETERTSRKTRESNQKTREDNKKSEDSNKKLGLSAVEAASQVAKIRAELTQLGRSNTGAGVNIDTVAARTELEKLRAKLDQIASEEPSVRVDAETAAAEAELRAIQSQLNRIDGQRVTAKVNVEDNGATQREAQNLQTLMSAAIAVSPALIGIGAAAAAGIGAIAPLAASAGAGLGVLALGFSGVGDAVKLLQQRQETVAANTIKSTATQVASAQQISSAQASLKNAQASAADGAISAGRRVADSDKNLSRARVDAAESVAKAQETAATDIQTALKQQESAERSLTTAQRSQKTAQDDLTLARKDAQQQLEDLTASSQENALAQRQSVLDVADARKKLDAIINDPTATNAQREQARIDFEEATLRQQELETQGKRLADQQADANTKGVEGSKQVVKAQQQVVEANEAVAVATENVGDAAAKVDKARTDGATAVAKAQREGAEKIADAQQQVADATREQASQQRQAAFSISQAQGSLQAALAATGAAGVSSLAGIDVKLEDVGASTLTFAKYVDGTLKPAFKRLQETAANGLLPGVQAGLDDLLKQEPRITRFVAAYSGALGGLVDGSLKRLSDPQWSRFFDTLERQGVPQLEAMWHSGDNLAESFASILTAFSPMATELAQGIEELSADFADWSAGLENSQGFHDFQAYVQENWPKIEAIIGNVADVVEHLIEAGAPIGASYLTGFKLLTDVLAGLPVPVVQALLTAFLGFKAVQSIVGTFNGIADSLLAVQKGINGLPEKMSALAGSSAAVEASAGGVAGKVGGVATSLGALSAALAVAGAAYAGYNWVLANEAKNRQAATDSLAGYMVAAQGSGDASKEAAAKVREYSDKTADLKKQIDDLGASQQTGGYYAAEQQAKLRELQGQYEDAKAKAAEYQAQQDQLTTSTSIGTGALATQATGYADFTNAASTQLSTYQQLLANKQQKEQQSAQATADSTADATDSWQNYVKDASVSLDEYAAKLEEQTTNHENWRANIVDVTKRGGSEVGTILAGMGEAGVQIAADMATASTGEFERMKAALIANAHESGQGVQDELKNGLAVAAQVAADGGKATAEAIAKQLGLGVGQVQAIAAQYGLTLADSINPIMLATGHEYVRVGAGTAAAHMGGYAQGGYTGDGGKYEPAGIVHRGEFVVDKEKTAKHLPLLEALHSGQLDGIPGYANGGKVGLIALGHRLQSMGALVAENPSFPPLDMHGHGATSLHYTGDAIDVNTRPGTSALEQRELAPMAALAQSLGFRTIFMAPDHYNHLHIDDGAAAGSIGSGGGPAVVLPTPPSTAPYGPPLSTAADAVMQTAYDAASSWVASNTASGDTGAGSYGGGSMRELGRQIAASMGFGNQFGAIDSIFTRESSWNPNAQNPNSTAYGIPQFLNSTWAQYGGKTSVPSAQIRDGIQYMVDRYGSPNGAKAFWDSHHWYDQGGIASGVGFMAKNTLEPERVLSPRETQAFEQMVSREFSGASGGAGGAAPVTVSLEGATVTGTFDFGSDGLVRLVDGRIEGQFQDLRRQTIRT